VARPAGGGPRGRFAWAPRGRAIGVHAVCRRSRLPGQRVTRVTGPYGVPGPPQRVAIRNARSGGRLRHALERPRVGREPQRADGHARLATGSSGHELQLGPEIPEQVAIVALRDGYIDGPAADLEHELAPSPAQRDRTIAVGERARFGPVGAEVGLDARGVHLHVRTPYRRGDGPAARHGDQVAADVAHHAGRVVVAQHDDVEVVLEVARHEHVVPGADRKSVV